MRIISWNINSVRARLPRLLALLKRHKPDILCLQETKVSDHEFPETRLSAAGYHSVLYGQTSYNGVAMLVRGKSKQRNLMAFAETITEETTTTGSELVFSEINRGFPNDPAPNEARVISACIGGFRIVNTYVINGEDRDSEKFELKGRWMKELGNWLQSLPSTPPLLVVGDFNVAPDDRDVWNPEELRDRIHCTTEERTWLRELQGKRLQDLLRAVNAEPGVYTWWPYMRNGFNRNEGLRFDLILGDKTTVKRISKIWVDKEEREPRDMLEAPSDHAPVIIETT